MQANKEHDPPGLDNSRTPDFSMNRIYGLGPDGSPHLYARNPEEPSMVGPKLLIGKNITVPFGNVQGDFENDLPRGPHGMALIGDPRNDENLLVAQTHLTFRSEEHTSELQSLMRTSYAVFCLKKKTN